MTTNKDDQKPENLVSSGFGPYLGYIMLVAVYGWPFFAFHGIARVSVGIPWLILAIAITIAAQSAKKSKGKGQ